MAERRAATTTKVASMILAHKNDANAHHVPGGGADIKGGVIAASTGSNDHVFGTAFASVPRVTLEPMGTLVLRDCLHKVTARSTTGFSFEVDIAADYAWIATDAGDP